MGNVKNDVLNLYYSDDLLKGWASHPQNPIVKFDKKIARPGGRVIMYRGRPYRFTQDDSDRYGGQVFALEITDLTANTYAEKMVSDRPVVTKTGKGWNAAGMHNVDPHKVGDKWISVVDGHD